MVGNHVLSDFKPENIINHESSENENAQTGDDLNMDIEPRNSESNAVASQSFSIFEEMSHVRIDNLKCWQGGTKGN